VMPRKTFAEVVTISATNQAVRIVYRAGFNQDSFRTIAWP
jgi:hypothetical protein